MANAANVVIRESAKSAISSLAANSYINRVTLQGGYQLCARCGHPILDGESAFVMYRAPDYGVFAHVFQCCNRSPRGWTKLLRYERMRETLTWNSERLPSCTALATLPPSKETFKYEDVMWKKGKTRDWEWEFTAGDPDWQRSDGCVDWSGSKMTVGDTVLTVVSLLNLAHIKRIRRCGY